MAVHEAVHEVPPLACFQRFVPAMRELWVLDLADEERWQRVRALLPMLLDDPELRELAGGWAETRAADGKHTNLLLYEDPQHGFVVNALVKAPGAATPVHDHAHTWTAYGVIYGAERVVRYRLEREVPPGSVAELTEAGSYVVEPGFIDVVPPRLPHAEYVGDSRTVALIVRSARVGGFEQRMWKHKTHVHFLAPGPEQLPYEFTFRGISRSP
jgi:predicted metal-dependent enzyme (double-stranded beta helix superfamily)